MSEATQATAKRVAVITGASGGIGSETARVFAARGYDLVLLDYNEETLSSLEQSLNGTTSVLAIAGDLADLAWCEQAIETAAKRFGKIDVLVNMAAWREIVTMTEISIESWQRTIDICLTAPAFLSRWCALHMPAGGAIINISSLNAKLCAGLAPAYSAAKGGLDSLTYDLAALYGPRGVRVVGVALGAIDTALSHDVDGTNDADNTDADTANADGGTTLRAYGEGIIPLRRYGTAEEAALAIAWMASSEASYLTGTVVELDGGWGHHSLPHGWKKKQFPTEYK